MTTFERTKGGGEDGVKRDSKKHKIPISICKSSLEPSVGAPPAYAFIENNFFLLNQV
jgi:hypothetical protein